ncbi:ribonuclease III [filamentous cyanobacterium CCP5]|nr:ribonuclease III [filamentous cyanobacterium CCP5]
MPDPTRQRNLQRCLLKLGVPETPNLNWALLDQALTHASASSTNYEQLEFLGDAALRLAAAEFLLEAYPQATVGELAAVRSRLVSDHTLADLGDLLGLESYLQVSASASRDVAGRRSRLADAFEAVLGVLYLHDHSLTLIRSWLDTHMARLAEQIRRDPTLQNYKAALQEITQATGGGLPEYRTEEISQIHGDTERFASTVWFQERLWGEGRGASMKQAEQAAARMAYEPLKQALSPGKS